MTTHEGHTDWVNSVAFSPDGKSVVSGSRDKTVRMWDTNSSSPIGGPLEGHSDLVWSVSYSPLGNLIASGSNDRTIRLWDPSTGQQSGKALKGDSPFFSVAFSPDAKLIASGSAGYFSSSSTGCAVQLWDVRTRKSASGPLKGHARDVKSVSFSIDGTRLVSGSEDKTIRVWDVERKSPILRPLKGHASPVRSVALSPDSAQIVSCSYDGIRLWDPRTGQPVGNPYTGHTSTVCSVSFSPRGTYISSGSFDKTVRLWDVRTGRQVAQPFKEHTDYVTSVAFSPCGQFVASGSYDCRVIIRRVLGEDQYPAAGDVEPQEVTSQMEVGQDDELNGDVEPQVITSQAFIPESHIDPDSDDDLGPQMVTSQMSTQQIFECLCRAGCIDLSSLMDTGQDTAMIASGGGFGDIWKGEMHTGVKVAIKAWRTTALGRCEYKTLKRAARELHLWSRMDHPHIHRLQGVILFRDQYLGMVSEWMDNGNLHDFLLKHPEADRYQLCIHVASGLEYMHGRNTVHGDLKALNVLVSSEGIARLSDFDFSIMSDASSLVFTASSNNRMGSIRWVAPELMSGTSKRTTQTDVYALGMTMLEIFTGDVPYPELRQDFAVMMVVTQGILPPRPAQYLTADEVGNRVWKLILDCWSQDPHARPSAERVLEVLKDGLGKT